GPAERAGERRAARLRAGHARRALVAALDARGARWGSAEAHAPWVLLDCTTMFCYLRGNGARTGPGPTRSSSANEGRTMKLEGIHHVTAITAEAQRNVD